MDCFTYIIASTWRGTIYTGVTSNLIQRVYQHKSESSGGFTAQYGLKRLVWFEGTSSIESAIRREKQIKNWKREWKIALVESMNPRWVDLYDHVLGAGAHDPGSSPG